MILSLVVPMSVPLFQSWYPDKPSFEMLDDKMQAGYKLNSSAKVEDGACIWLEAWNYILYFCACDRQPAEDRAERFVPVWKRKKVQEMLRRIAPMLLGAAGRESNRI